MEMKFRKASLPCRLREQNTGLVFGGKQIPPAAEAAEGVAMEKLWHGG